MKKVLTPDLLSGILIACVIHDVWRAAHYFLPINWEWMALSTQARVYSVAIMVITAAIYSFVIGLVLLRRESTERIVFWILLLIAIVWMVFNWFCCLRPQLESNPFRLVQVLALLTGAPLTALVAFIRIKL